MQLRCVIRLCIYVDDQSVIVKVPRSFTVREVLQKGLSSLWKKPVSLSDIENICVFRASDPSYSLLSPTSTLEEYGIQDMEALSSRSGTGMRL